MTPPASAAAIVAAVELSLRHGLSYRDGAVLAAYLAVRGDLTIENAFYTGLSFLVLVAFRRRLLVPQDPVEEFLVEPRRVEGLSQVVHVAAGSDTSFAIIDFPWAALQGKPANARGLVFASFLPRPCNYGSRSRPGAVLAMTAKKGKVVWRRAIASESTPLVVGRLVYVGAWDHRVYALYARTGRVAWSFRTDGEINSSPAYANGTIYIGNNAGSLYALVALGIVLIYRSTRVLNFAHGNVATLGTFVAFAFVSQGYPFALAFPVALAVGATAILWPGAVTPPIVVITSNRTREVHDALKRRCVYSWIDYPSAETERGWRSRLLGVMTTSGLRKARCTWRRRAWKSCAGVLG